MKEQKNTIEGKIWVLGDNINTDLIVPSKVLTEQDPRNMVKATLEIPLPEFSEQAEKGDIIVAGSNFGCGSSREEAVYVLKVLGISAIVAKSFSRIYYRNCINLGISPIMYKDPSGTFQQKVKGTANPIGTQGDVIKINRESGEIQNISNPNF
ncbi:MAG TPA: hypothetical protein VKO42_03935, partial [Patescibacteria group bacterium]|nr:hypothetical protein [Patescibacteria group bacterium]